MSTELIIRSRVGPPLSAFLRPWAMARNLWDHRHLTWQLASREIAARYRGAHLGLLWSVLTPLVMLGICMFVFAIVFKARWGDDPHEPRGVFALNIFCGMLLYNLFAEVANKAPWLVVGNPNYVKKVVFPLEILVVSAVISALVNRMLIGCGVWVVVWLLIQGAPPPWTILVLPLVFLPVCLLSAGVGWVLASAGVFVRDLSHLVVLVVQLLFFATPILYPLQRVPPRVRVVMRFNPFTHAVRDMRRIMTGGEFPMWHWWAVVLAASAILAVVGYALFMKSKRAFADVL